MPDLDRARAERALLAAGLQPDAPLTPAAQARSDRAYASELHAEAVAASDPEHRAWAVRQATRAAAGAKQVERLLRAPRSGIAAPRARARRPRQDAAQATLFDAGKATPKDPRSPSRPSGR
jgi:hypothetical protein